MNAKLFCLLLLSASIISTNVIIGYFPGCASEAEFYSILQPGVCLRGQLAIKLDEDNVDYLRLCDENCSSCVLRNTVTKSCQEHYILADKTSNQTYEVALFSDSKCSNIVAKTVYTSFRKCERNGDYYTIVVVHDGSVIYKVCTDPECQHNCEITNFSTCKGANGFYQKHQPYSGDNITPPARISDGIIASISGLVFLIFLFY